MLKLDARTINSLPATIAAIKELNKLIEYYSGDVKAGCAYVSARFVRSGTVDFQLDRDLVVDTLKRQKQRYVNYIKELGIELIEE